MKKDTLYLVWKDQYNNKYKVGELYKEDNQFFFKYLLDTVKIAMENGFRLLIAFPQLNAIYYNSHLFPAFSTRVPDKRRPEIDKILSTYNMDKYDEFELLKRSKGKTPIDDYEFEQK
ncbi:MAG: hypothetical protein RSC92_03830 [Clostridia bacterium]